MELFDIVSLIGLLNISVDLRAPVLLIVILSFSLFWLQDLSTVVARRTQQVVTDVEWTLRNKVNCSH